MLIGRRRKLGSDYQVRLATVESEALEIAMELAQVRRRLEEQERQREEKEEQARKIAAELFRLKAAVDMIIFRVAMAVLCSTIEWPTRQYIGPQTIP